MNNPDQIKKLESLRNFVTKGIGLNQGALADYVSTADLTTSFLFASEHGGKIGQTTLQLIADGGYLFQIPESCLTPRVVLKWQKYLQLNLETKEQNLLCYFASRGHYEKLPKTYLTRTAILHHNKRDPSKVTPLRAAAAGYLNTLPLHLLKKGDLDADTLYEACIYKELKLIKDRLVTADNVDARILRQCFQWCTPKTFRKAILRGFTPEKMLEKPEDEDSALTYAAWQGHLKKLPALPFAIHFKAAKGAVVTGMNYLKSSNSGRHNISKLNSRIQKQRLADCMTWLTALGQATLGQSTKDGGHRVHF